MKKTVLMLCMFGSIYSSMAMAETTDNLVAAADPDAGTNFRIGPRVASPESTAPVQDNKLFSKQGQWLSDHGVSPHVGLTEVYLGNPSVGTQTNNYESLSLISVGADFDLNKIIGLQGGYVHFEELFVPWTHNLGYGGQAASVIAGKPGPYIPKVSHLTLFTYEQKLLDDKLSIEAGKSNAGNYMATPICNTGFTCVNAILQDSAGINPPPYANWSTRIAYNVSPKLRVQAGWWRSNNAFPFTNGWEGDAGDSGGTLSDVYLADVAYKTDFSMEKYPVTVEAMGFHNTSEQVNPLTSATSNSANGVYLAGKKTFWRQDGGNSNDPNPKSLAVFGALTHSFEENTTNGVETQLNTGIILNHPFESRPYDSYSVSFIWDQLTKSEQRFLQQSYTGADSYKPGRNEYAIALDANFILSDSLVVSPFIMRTFNSSSWMNPTTSTNPKSGIALGVALHIQLDTLLGFNPHPHP
ncbi:carbohydrate porin [Acinetobacter soli]|uniref:carbohydrate porin n=1 Tax=Acinetobacter soli TaxID=487316 RepID=UPI00148F349A|nr:carbohydrate porin [Acinetobacter soli]